MSLCPPVIWSMAAMLRDSVVVVRTRPRANTASHDNHGKINSWVSFSFPYMGCLWGSAWRRYGPPELRYYCIALSRCEIYDYVMVLFWIFAWDMPMNDMKRKRISRSLSVYDDTKK